MPPLDAPDATFPQLSTQITPTVSITQSSLPSMSDCANIFFTSAIFSALVPGASNCTESCSEPEAVPCFNNSLVLASNDVYFAHCALAFSVTNQLLASDEDPKRSIPLDFAH
uniref:Uncharacterized protein n=1 Tax=Arundo donax TaxID=35708 RepID=A0A0A9GH41_ARUDO